MRYCVIKDTTKVINNGLNTDESFLSDAKSAGLEVNKVEVLTKEEFESRKALEEQQPKEPSEIEILKQENARLQEEDLNNKEAIAELYILSKGGI